MARALRIAYPDAFYHVMHRGNARSDIFVNDRDREKFLEYVASAVNRYGIKIHAFCLMDNHYHLLVETPEPNLSQAVKWINVSYAVYFNRKRNRFGHLFQGRFKAMLVDADEYLKPLSRYIHLNPVRAGTTAHCKDYHWSSYPFLSGYATPPDWLETQWLLSLFGKDLKSAHRRYRDYVEAVQHETIENPGKHAVSGMVLGGADFVDWVKQTFLSSEPEHKEIPQLTRLKPRLTTDDIVAVVREAFDCARQTPIMKGKKGNLARDAAIYLCRELTGETGVELGRYFGGISGAGITVRHNHVRTQIQNDRMLRRKIEKIQEKLIIKMRPESFP